MEKVRVSEGFDKLWARPELLEVRIQDNKDLIKAFGNEIASREKFSTRLETLGSNLRKKLEPPMNLRPLVSLLEPKKTSTLMKEDDENIEVGLSELSRNYIGMSEKFIRLWKASLQDVGRQRRNLTKLHKQIQQEGGGNLELVPNEHIKELRSSVLSYNSSAPFLRNTIGTSLYGLDENESHFRKAFGVLLERSIQKDLMERHFQKTVALEGFYNEEKSIDPEKETMRTFEVITSGVSFSIPESAVKMETKAKFEYQADGEGELSVIPGEKVRILEGSNDLNGWWHVKKQDGAIGYVPGGFFEKPQIVQNFPENESFVRVIETYDDILMGQIVFYIRPAPQFPDWSLIQTELEEIKLIPIRCLEIYVPKVDSLKEH